MRKAEYDFLTWKSFPSSAKLINDEGPGKYAFWYEYTPEALPVKPGARLKIEVWVKQENVIYGNYPTFQEVSLRGFDGSRWKFIGRVEIPLGTFDWRKLTSEIKVPEDVYAVRWMPYIGSGTKTKPGVAWFDDLRIYQDGVLVYEDKFSNWLPYQIAGAIALSIPTALYAIPRLKRR